MAKILFTFGPGNFVFREDDEDCTAPSRVLPYSVFHVFFFVERIDCFWISPEFRVGKSTKIHSSVYRASRINGYNVLPGLLGSFRVEELEAML